MHLYIGYQNYSSWSLRPWLLMKVIGIDFSQSVLPFMHSDQLRQLAAEHQLPAQVPILQHADLMVPDSLAIAEYLAERFPDRRVWPEDLAQRTMARVASAEMHSGFPLLRSRCPLNCRAQKSLPVDAPLQLELDRLAVIWRKFAQAGRSSDGPFLCGQFSAVDAMYAPVMWRVSGYSLEVSDDFVRWSQAMMALPAMQQWLAAAQAEPWQIAAYDEAAPDR